MNKPKVLFTEQQIAQRVGELGPQIGEAYAGRELTVVGLMKGCLVFMADLIRKIPTDLSVHLVRVTSQREEEAGTARTEIIYTTTVPYENRDILILDDIVDTGITLNFLLDHIRERKPKSLRVCTLIDKPGERKIDVHPDWAAFTLREPLLDQFLVGYGLDYAESYRGLPFIGTIPRPAAGRPGGVQ